MLIVLLRTIHSYFSIKKQKLQVFPVSATIKDQKDRSRFVFRCLFILFFLAIIFFSYLVVSSIILPTFHYFFSFSSFDFSNDSGDVSSSFSSLSSHFSPGFHGRGLSSDSNETSSSSEHESPSSLFGIIAELDPAIGTLSFIILVAAILVVEFLFYGLQIMAHETPFEHLIPAVQKELMIAGCTAFSFKVIVNATNYNLSMKWYHALEYAGRRSFFFLSFFLSFQ
jgi:hypothetical protein